MHEEFSKFISIIALLIIVIIIFSSNNNKLCYYFTMKITLREKGPRFPLCVLKLRAQYYLTCELQ